jgi:hypothetical protein
MRDGSASQDKRTGDVSYRHRRNFGGNSFENAAQKVQHCKEQKVFIAVAWGSFLFYSLNCQFFVLCTLIEVFLAGISIFLSSED